MSRGERLLQWAIGVWGLFALFYALQIVHLQTAYAGMHENAAIARPRFQVFGDVFELPNNDTPAQATNPAITFCSRSPVFQNLTIYRSDLSNPAADLDWFKVNPGAQRLLFITVTIQQITTNTVSDDLALVVQVYDFSGINVIGGFEVFTYSRNRSSSTSLYVPVGGSFYFVRISAFNPTELNQSQFKPYSLQICQSDDTVTPTPQPPPTPVGANPDPYEPNDLPSIVQAQKKSFVNVGQQLTNLNFYTQPNTGTLDLGDVDWYFFSGRGGAV